MAVSPRLRQTLCSCAALPCKGDREWLARSAGWYGIVVVGWSAFFGLLLLGSYLSDQSNKFANTLWNWLGSIGGVSGAISLLLGKMPWTTAKGADRKSDKKSWSLDSILNVTVPLFAAALVVMASALIDILVFGEPLRPTKSANTTALVIAMIFAGAVGWLALTFVNINRFSLHALYRNRIIRAFLGASRAPDRPLRNLFTDFDDADNPRMYQLWQKGVQPKGDNWRPLHVVNMALIHQQN